MVYLTNICQIIGKMQGRYLLTLKIIVKVISAGSGPLRSVCHRFGLFVSARNKDRLTGFYIKSSVALLNTNWLVYIRLNTISHVGKLPYSVKSLIDYHA